MTTSEARRQGLYNSLRDLIGPDNADTLIEHLPTAKSSELATREDIATLRADFNFRFDRIDNRFERFEDRFEDRFRTVEARFNSLGERLDRIVLSLVGALLAMVTAFLVQAFI